MSLQNITFALPLVILVFTGIYASYYYSKFSQEFKYISWFVFFSLGIQIPSAVMGRFGLNNLFFLHLYVPLSYLLLAQFYVKVFDGFINRTIIWSSVVLFVLFSILNSVFLQNLQTFNAYALSVESVLIIIFSLSLFILLLNESVRNEKKNYYFKSHLV